MSGCSGASSRVAPPSISPEPPAMPDGEQIQPVLDGSSFVSEEAAATDLESEALP